MNRFDYYGIGLVTGYMLAIFTFAFVKFLKSLQKGNDS